MVWDIQKASKEELRLCLGRFGVGRWRYAGVGGRAWSQTQRQEVEWTNLSLRDWREGLRTGGNAPWLSMRILYKTPIWYLLQLTLMQQTLLCWFLSCTYKLESTLLWVFSCLINPFWCLCPSSGGFCCSAPTQFLPLSPQPHTGNPNPFTDCSLCPAP